MDTYQMPAKVVQQVNSVKTSTDQLVFFRFGRQSTRDDLLHVEAKAFVTTGKAALDQDPESIRELSHKWGRKFLREFLPSKGYNLDVDAHIGVSVAGERCESIDVYDRCFLTSACSRPTLTTLQTKNAKADFVPWVVYLFCPHTSVLHCLLHLP